MSAAATDSPPAPRVAHLYRYPLKGFTGEALPEAALEAGECMAFDRAYAIENGAGRFDPLEPRHLPKINFLMLMRNERIATLRTHFEDASETLTIHRDGNQVATGQLTTPIGRQLIEQFVSSYFASELRGAPKVVRAPGHSFSDVPVKCLHIVNLASVRDLERVTGRPVDPLRFRANIYIDGFQPWQEFEWLGKTLEAGATELSVFTRTERCDATNVDPATGARDMSIPNLLHRQWGHTDFGIYAKVARGGTVAVGDAFDVKP